MRHKAGAFAVTKLAGGGLLRELGNFGPGQGQVSAVTADAPPRLAGSPRPARSVRSGG